MVFDIPVVNSPRNSEISLAKLPNQLCQQHRKKCFGGDDKNRRTQVVGKSCNNWCTESLMLFDIPVTDSLPNSEIPHSEEADHFCQHRSKKCSACPLMMTKTCPIENTCQSENIFPRTATCKMLPVPMDFANLIAPSIGQCSPHCSCDTCICLAAAPCICLAVCP